MHLNEGFISRFMSHVLYWKISSRFRDLSLKGIKNESISRHNFNFDSTTIIKKYITSSNLDFFKAVHIYKFRNSLVNDFASVPLHLNFLDAFVISRCFTLILISLVARTWFSFGTLFSEIWIFIFHIFREIFFYFIRRGGDAVI